MIIVQLKHTYSTAVALTGPCIGCLRKSGIFSENRFVPPFLLFWCPESTLQECPIFLNDSAYHLRMILRIDSNTAINCTLSYVRERKKKGTVPNFATESVSTFTKQRCVSIKRASLGPRILINRLRSRITISTIHFTNTKSSWFLFKEIRINLPLNFRFEFLRTFQDLAEEQNTEDLLNYVGQERV